MSIENEASSDISLAWNRQICAPEGVIVGCTQDQEKFLPWWWMNFRLFNNYPVTFIDFGDMSAIARKWCRQRGSLLSLDLSDTFIARKEAIDPALVKIWEKMNTDVWRVRLAWFKKPFALLQSPYEKTVWLDLDCQTKGSIQPLFNEYLNNAEFAISREPESYQKINQERGILLPEEIMYNSGVTAFRHNSKIIQEWAKEALERSHLFYGDQQLLSRILFTSKLPFAVIPDIYNSFVLDGINPKAIILHWYGSSKEAIPIYIDQLKQYFCIDLTLTAGM